MAQILTSLRIAALLGLAFAAPAAAAEGRSCAQREKVVARLAERFGETLQSIGLQSERGVVEIYASEATGTWTILLTGPDGAACLVAAGEAWESLRTVPGAPA